MAEGGDALTPRERYREGEVQARLEAESLEWRLLRTSQLRLLFFALAVGPFLLLETTARAFWLALIAAGSIAGLAFLGLLRSHLTSRRRLARARLRETLNREAQARLSRTWDDLPPPPLLAASEDHPSAGDLDLVGRASLTHLIGRVVTAPGKLVLRQLLLDPFAPLPADGTELLARIGAAPPPPTAGPHAEWGAAIAERQEAVQVLADEIAFREGIELLGREAARGGIARHTEVFLEWLARPGWLADHSALLFAARFLAIFTPATLVGWLLGVTPGFLPALGGLAAVWIFRMVAPQAHERLSAAEAGQGDLLAWSAQLEVIARLPKTGALLGRLGDSVREPPPGAGRAIRKLLRITDTAGVRRSSLAHFPLVVLFVWDVHMLDWLERWHARYAHAAGRWIRALGEAEALAALGGLRHDHPDWTFAHFGGESGNEAGEGIHAMRLGHPLLDPERAVSNDVEIPGPGRLLLVTGSNMAGKTTLLRAVGVNQVLALAGGPVAAASFETRPLLPWCTMRVRDSLEGGVSYFLAELQRLKKVVEAARTVPSLYLLDEILQGTNSEERRIAAQMVLGRLLQTRSVGVITTHDLALASAGELDERVVNVHFREEVTEVEGKHALSFDYRLRPGPATSRNALVLLEIVGLVEEGSATVHQDDSYAPRESN